MIKQITNNRTVVPKPFVPSWRHSQKPKRLRCAYCNEFIQIEEIHEEALFAGKWRQWHTNCLPKHNDAIAKEIEVADAASMKQFGFDVATRERLYNKVIPAFETPYSEVRELLQALNKALATFTLPNAKDMEEEAWWYKDNDAGFILSEMPQAAKQHVAERYLLQTAPQLRDYMSRISNKLDMLEEKTKGLANGDPKVFQVREE